MKMKIPSIILKNFKVLFRHKISLFILLLGPILIILILGFIFNSQSVININVGYHVEEENELNSQYIDNLRMSNYRLIKYNSQQGCIENIESGLNDVCIFFYPSQEDSSQEKVEINVDTSRTNLVYIIENVLVSSFEVQTQRIQLNNTKVILRVINQSERISKENRDIFFDLRTLSNVLKTNQQRIGDLTQRLEVTFNPDYLNIEALQASSEELDESRDSFTTEIRSVLDDIETSANSISSSFDSANFTSEARENETSDELDNLEENLELMSSVVIQFQQAEDIESLRLVIENMVDVLNRIDEDITNIIANLNEVTFNIESIEQRLSEDINSLENSNSRIINAIENIELREAQQVISPIDIEVRSVVPQTQNNLNSSFPAIISTLIFIVSMLLSSNFILAEKTSNAYFRNFLSKAKSRQFFAGNFLILFLIIFIQMTLLLSFYYLIIQQTLDIELLVIILSIVPIIAVFVLLGMVIGYISNNQTVNIILSFIVITLLISFSGFLIPLEILSSTVVDLSLLNPYLISTAILRKLVIFNSDFLSVLGDFFLIIVYIILFFLIGLLLESANNRRTIYKYFYLFISKVESFYENQKRKFRRQSD